MKKRNKPNEIDVLNFISRYKISFNTKPSLQTIASEMGVKVGQIRKLIRELERHDYFGEKYEQKKSKSQNRKIYTKPRFG